MVITNSFVTCYSQNSLIFVQIKSIEKLKIIYHFFILFFITFQLNAQVDSIFRTYKISYQNESITNWDTSSVSKILDFCSKNQGYASKLSDSIVTIVIENESKIVDFKSRVKYITKAKITKANCQMLLGNYDASKKYFKEVISDKNVKEVDKIKAESNLGIMYYFKGEYSQAIEYYLSSMDKAKKYNLSTVNQLVNICLIYQLLNNYDNQLYYSELALKESIIRKDTSGMVYSYNSLGLAYKYVKNFDKAIDCFKKAISISEKINEYVTISDANTNLGNIYSRLKRNNEAMKCYKISLEMNRKIDRDLFSSFIAISSGYIAMGDLRSAKLYSDSSKLYLNSNQPYYDLEIYYDTQSSLYYKLGKFKEACDYLTLSNNYSDSVINEENKSQINNLEQEYALRKSRLEDSLKFALREKGIREKNALSSAKKNAQLKLQKGIIIFSIAFALLLLGTILYIFKMYKTKKEANEIIAKQKNIADLQKAEISEKNKALTDSINYAKNLQDALLPSESSIHAVFPETGLVYLPKDIVSGDFYWIYQKEHIKYMAVADCTGHGVPGAMMSLIGINGLERCVKENLLTEPADILNQLNELVEKAFSSQNYDINDGMDISLIKFNTLTRELSFAGAYNPLWIFSKKKWEDLSLNKTEIENTFLYTFNANKQPIGKFRDRVPFTQQNFILPERSKIILLTDGYADQFGGLNGKKFKYQAFRKIIANNLNESPKEISEILSTTFKSWKHHHEQVDDVTVVILEL